MGLIRSKENLMLISTGTCDLSFSDVAQVFVNGLACIDAYEELKGVCMQLSKTDPDNAAVYFLVFGFARSYVLLYEEDAVPPERAQRAKRQMSRYLDILASALADGSTLARLSALNAVVLDYLQSDRIF
jgi:uncharacterized membrane protein